MIFIKNTWKYDFFCIFGKNGISLSYKYDINLLSKRKDDFLPKKFTSKWHFWYHWKRWYSSYIVGISSDRKIKDDKKIFVYRKVPMILCTFMETFICVFIFCFLMKKKTLNIWDWNLTSSLSYMIGDILQWRIFNNL